MDNKAIQLFLAYCLFSKNNKHNTPEEIQKNAVKNSPKYLPGAHVQSSHACLVYVYVYIYIYMYKGSGKYPCALLSRQFLTVENTKKNTRA